MWDVCGHDLTVAASERYRLDATYLYTPLITPPRSRPPTRGAPSGAAIARADVTEAIHHALLEELAERGYGRTSVEAVARRAGVGKAAIYRRWPSKRELVVGVVSAAGVRPQDLADTGSLRGDVLAFLRVGRSLLANPLARRIIPDLLAEAIRSPTLGDILEREIGEPRRQLAKQVLEYAIARGELSAELDFELALDVVPAPLYWRVSVRRQAISDDELERLATAIVAALGAL